MTALLFRGEHRRFRRLFEQRLDELREAVACPVEPAFHRSQVATSDVRNLGVALSLELPQYEHRPVVVGELPHALVHSLLEVALAVEVVRARYLKEAVRSEEHTSELQSRLHLVCRLLLEKKKAARASWR